MMVHNITGSVNSSGTVGFTPGVIKPKVTDPITNSDQLKRTSNEAYALNKALPYGVALGATLAGGILGYHTVSEANQDQFNLTYTKGKQRLPVLSVKNDEIELNDSAAEFILSPDAKTLKQMTRITTAPEDWRIDPKTGQRVAVYTTQKELFNNSGLLDVASLENTYSILQGQPFSQLSVVVKHPEKIDLNAPANSEIASAYDVYIGLTSGLKDAKDKNATTPCHEILINASSTEPDKRMTFSHSGDQNSGFGCIKFGDEILHEPTKTDPRLARLGQWVQHEGDAREFKSLPLALNSQQRLQELKNTLPDGESLEALIAKMSKKLQGAKTNRMLLGSVLGGLSAGVAIAMFQFFKKPKTDARVAVPPQKTSLLNSSLKS